MDDAPEVTSSATGTANEENSDLKLFTQRQRAMLRVRHYFYACGTDASLLEINPSTVL